MINHLIAFCAGMLGGAAFQALWLATLMYRMRRERQRIAEELRHSSARATR